MRRLLLLGLLAASSAHSQSLPVLSQNPPALRWREVRTPHFRVLYAGGIDSAAQRTAARLEQLHGPTSATLGVRPRPISVVLQNQTTVPNGFVTFLPRHAEFFTTPQQGFGLGTVDWLDGLVVHEFRHVGQFEKARQGIGRLLGPLLGDGALGVAAVGVPQWFFEGDAVGTETALTRSGRGRIPNFNVGLRANLLSGRRYSYQKAANGSLRDNVPDWYVLGYFMTSYLKAHHGADVWARTLDRYYRFPFYPFSFSNAIRRTTGLRVEALYERSMSEVDSLWRQQHAAAASPTEPAFTAAKLLRQQASEKVFTQYQYPQYLTDSTVLALKTGFDDIPRFVRLSQSGREEKVFTPGQLNIPEMLSVNGGKAVWPEYQQHARWGQRIASELKVLDLKTGQLTRIGRGQRYTVAALSPDGRRLVAVRETPEYHHELVVLDAQTGAELQVLPNPHNDIYLQPRWFPDGRRIVAVALRAAGKTLVVITPAMYLPDPATGQVRPEKTRMTGMEPVLRDDSFWSSPSPIVSMVSDGRMVDLLPVANVNLTNPQPWGDYVFYNSSQSGIDNLYAVDVRGETYRVTNRPFGAYHATISPDGRTLAFHDYRATGARVVEIPLNPATWTLVPTATQDTFGPYAETLAAQEPAGAQVAAMLARPDSAGPRYGVRRYSPLAHAFNLFSYGVVQSPGGNAVAVGLRSQDLLNTTQVFAGLGYDQTERTFNVTGAVSYQGRYPVLDADLTYGGRDVAVLYRGGVLRDQWQYARLSAGVRLPLTLTHSKYLQALTVGTYFLHEQVYGYDLPGRLSFAEVLPNAPLNALQTTLSYATQLKRSVRSVAPKWGGTFLGTWRTTPFGTGLYARQWGAQAALYLPGLARNHAIRLRGGYQWQDQLEYRFAPAVSFPRGEGYVSFDRLAVGSLDYNLPLAFTHWELGRWLYIQRLRATVFGDLARGSDVRGTTGRLDYRNVGVDALVLFNVLRLRTPVEAGVRATYRGAVKQWLIEPLAFSLRL